MRPAGIIDDLRIAGRKPRRSPLRIIKVRSAEPRASAVFGCNDSPCTGMTVRGLTADHLFKPAWRG
jgi:hypothetical protein